MFPVFFLAAFPSSMVPRFVEALFEFSRRCWTQVGAIGATLLTLTFTLSVQGHIVCYVTYVVYVCSRWIFSSPIMLPLCNPVTPSLAVSGSKYFGFTLKLCKIRLYTHTLVMRDRTWRTWSVFGLFDDLHSVFPCPFRGRFIVFSNVRFVNSCNIRHQGIVWVWWFQQWNNAQQNWKLTKQIRF